MRTLIHSATVVDGTETGRALRAAKLKVIGEIMQSRIPVIVWVAPQGSRAASAGTFIAYAAHRTYMAAATELGAATPVNLSGEDLPPDIERKATNDAVAFITELARAVEPGLMATPGPRYFGFVTGGIALAFLAGTIIAPASSHPFAGAPRSRAVRS